MVNFILFSCLLMPIISVASYFIVWKYNKAHYDEYHIVMSKDFQDEMQVLGVVTTILCALWPFMVILVIAGGLRLLYKHIKKRMVKGHRAPKSN